MFWFRDNTISVSLVGVSFPKVETTPHDLYLHSILPEKGLYLRGNPFQKNIGQRELLSVKGNYEGHADTDTLLHMEKGCRKTPHDIRKEEW